MVPAMVGCGAPPRYHWLWVDWDATRIRAGQYIWCSIGVYIVVMPVDSLDYPDPKRIERRRRIRPRHFSCSRLPFLPYFLLTTCWRRRYAGSYRDLFLPHHYFCCIILPLFCFRFRLFLGCNFSVVGCCCVVVLMFAFY